MTVYLIENLMADYYIDYVAIDLVLKMRNLSYMHNLTITFKILTSFAFSLICPHISNVTFWRNNLNFIFLQYP